MTTDKYILDANGSPVVEPDLMTWAAWFETASRIVRQQRFGPCSVSTVFLGLDHNFRSDGPPILWETMIFGPGRLNHCGARCAGSREQAEALHVSIVHKMLFTDYRNFNWRKFTNRKRRLKAYRQLKRLL